MKIVKIVLIGLAALFMSAEATAQQVTAGRLPDGHAKVLSVNQNGSLNLAPEYDLKLPKREGKTYCCTLSCSREEFLLHYTQGIFYLCQYMPDGSIRNVYLPVSEPFTIAPCKRIEVKDSPENSANQDLGLLP